MLACFSFFGPCLVPPWASAGPSFTSSNVFCHLGGAIAGSWVPFCSSFEAICCSRAPFLASTWHLFGRFRGQFDVQQFFPCIAFKQGTDQLPVMIAVKVAHHQVKVSCTYASRNALLTAHAARSAALTSSIYIYIYMRTPPTPTYLFEGFVLKNNRHRRSNAVSKKPHK